MASEIKPQKSQRGQVILLAILQAMGWFILQELVLSSFYQGQALGGEDFGLWNVMQGMILFILWGYLVSRIAGWLLIGMGSWSAFIGGLIAIPTSFVLYSLFAMRVVNGRTGIIFDSFLFRILSFNGLIPEGRPGMGGSDAFISIIIFLVGLLGFSRTARRYSGFVSKLLPLVFGLSLLSGRAFGYDEVSHEFFLTREAASLLDQTSDQGYGEVMFFATDLAQGTLGEDIPASKVVEHFYRPTDQSGLGLPFTRSARQKLIDEQFFNKAIDDYKQGSKKDAFQLLGHVLHLASQDMFSAPHVHLDIHFDPGVVNFAPNSYESWVKDNRNMIALNSLRSGQSVPDLTGDPNNALHENAALTYSAVRIPGTLIRDITTPASGVLANMFPSISLDLECVDMECISLEGIWTIPNAGICRERTGASGSPGIFDNWWKAQNFPGETGDFFYVENAAVAFPVVYKDGTPAGGKSLAELWALDKERLIAKAQEASAGLMKQFGKIVDPLAPQMTLKDSSGNTIPNNGSTNSTSVTVEASDPADAGSPTASGIYRFVLSGPVSSTQTFSGLPNGQTGAHAVTHVFPTFAAGNYTVTAYDGLGNKASVRFRMDPTQPGGAGGAGSLAWTPPPVTANHPDDNASVSSPQYSYPWLIDTAGNVGLMLAGYADGVGHTLGKYGLATAPVEGDLGVWGPDNRPLSDLKTLVLASGALAGKDTGTFREALRQYVGNGGTLVALDQSLGEDFAVLPRGNELTAYGWDQDQSCFGDGVYLASAHPALSGQNRPTLNVSVDGYFSRVPVDAKILLRRTVNQTPALIEYAYGQGRVIAGTIFPDWGAGHGQWSEEAARLMRDIVVYAESRGEVLRLSPNGAGTAGVAVEYEGSGQVPAASAEVKVYSPVGSLASTRQLPVDLSPGQSQTISTSLTAEADLGMGRVTYLLKDAQGSVRNGEGDRGNRTNEIRRTYEKYENIYETINEVIDKMWNLGKLGIQAMIR